jgi:adenosylhomocysteine nucleosidase
MCHAGARSKVAGEILLRRYELCWEAGLMRFWPIFSLALAAGAASGFAQAAAPAPGTAIVIAAATDAELVPLRSHLADVRTETTAAWQFWVGSLGGRTVVLTRTEGDPLNAVAATTLAIQHHHPALVIAIGSAQALVPDLHPGDVVVSEKFAAMDGMISPVTGIGGGTHPLQWHLLPHLPMHPGEQEMPALSFPADAAAVAVAQHLSSPCGRVVVAVLGSSGQTNREADRIAWLREKWGASCADGESAPIAGCAQLLGVPALGLRVIDGKPGEAAGVALQFLEALQ